MSRNCTSRPLEISQVSQGLQTHAVSCRTECRPNLSFMLIRPVCQWIDPGTHEDVLFRRSVRDWQPRQLATRALLPVSTHPKPFELHWTIFTKHMLAIRRMVCSLGQWSPQHSHPLHHPRHSSARSTACLSPETHLVCPAAMSTCATHLWRY